MIFPPSPTKLQEAPNWGAWEVVGCPHGKKPRDIPRLQDVSNAQKLKDKKKVMKKVMVTLEIKPTI